MSGARQSDIQQADPANIEVEQALLGAILVNNDAFYRVSDFLNPEHFLEPIHQTIYEIVSSLVRAGKTATPITLKSFLPSDCSIGGLNASQYLARLAAEATGILNAEDYGALVHDLALRRALISVYRDGLALAYDSPIDAPARQQLEEVEQRLFELDDTSKRRGTDLVPIGRAMSEAMESAALAYKTDGRTIGVPWGLKKLDGMTTGLHAGELVVLAGRPSAGKSAVAVSIAERAADSVPPGETAASGVLMISPEMTAQSLGARMLTGRAARGGSTVAYSSLRDGNFRLDQFENLVDTARLSADLPILIDDSATLSMAGLASAVRRAAMRFRREGRALRLVIVDYLQLLQAGDRYRGKRVDEVSEISGGLKRIARDERVAVLALSQLSRDVERREDKRPMLSDLRDSGSIEQDADTVVFAYRESYYLERHEPKIGTPAYAEWEASMMACQGKLDLIVAKQRHGPIGVATVYFEAKTNSVRDISDTPSQEDGFL